MPRRVHFTFGAVFLGALCHLPPALCGVPILDVRPVRLSPTHPHTHTSAAVLPSLLTTTPPFQLFSNSWSTVSRAPGTTIAQVQQFVLLPVHF